MKLQFVVEGPPKTAGSKKTIPNRKHRNHGGSITGIPCCFIIEDCAASGPWRRIVAAVAKVAMARAGRAGRPLVGALSATFEFELARPKGEISAAGPKKESAREFHVCKPDALKLARAAEDALTGIVYRDDAQIVEEHIFKGFGPRPSMTITIEPLEACDG